MDKMTCGIIYTVKNKGYSREEIAKFMHYYTDTPIEYYSDAIIDNLMERTLVEATRSNKNPASIINEYFYWRRKPWCYSDFEAICAALCTIQVKETNPETGELEYINGFRPIENFDNYF